MHFYWHTLYDWKALLNIPTKLSNSNWWAKQCYCGRLKQKRMFSGWQLIDQILTVLEWLSPEITKENVTIVL